MLAAMPTRDEATISVQTEVSERAPRTKIRDFEAPVVGLLPNWKDPRTGKGHDPENSLTLRCHTAETQGEPLEDGKKTIIITTVLEISAPDAEGDEKQWPKASAADYGLAVAAAALAARRGNSGR